MPHRLGEFVPPGFPGLASQIEPQTGIFEECLQEEAAGALARLRRPTPTRTPGRAMALVDA